MGRPCSLENRTFRQRRRGTIPLFERCGQGRVWHGWGHGAPLPTGSSFPTKESASELPAMNTESCLPTILLTPGSPSGARVALRGALGILRRGGLVAIPTETVYGLAANAEDEEAVRRIFVAKGRPSHNPLIVHVADAAHGAEFTTRWPEEATALAKAFWPGPLTMVLPAGGRVARSVLAGGRTVGLRAPCHPLALELIRSGPIALAAPSANRSNALSPTTAEAVFDDLAGRIDAVLDGGECGVGIESTVLDLTEPTPRVLRPGMVTAGEIAEVLGGEVAQGGADDGPVLRSPGQLSRHYAPRIPLELVATMPPASAEAFQVRLGVREVWEGGEVVLPAEPEAYARTLYRALRWAERSGRARIVLQLPPRGPKWEAVHDRLRRGATAR